MRWVVEFKVNGHDARVYVQGKSLDDATNAFAAHLSSTIWPSDEDDVEDAVFNTIELPDGRLLVDVKLNHKDGEWTGTTKAAKFSKAAY